MSSTVDLSLSELATYEYQLLQTTDTQHIKDLAQRLASKLPKQHFCVIADKVGMNLLHKRTTSYRCILFTKYLVMLVMHTLVCNAFSGSTESLFTLYLLFNYLVVCTDTFLDVNVVIFTDLCCNF